MHFIRIRFLNLNFFKERLSLPKFIVKLSNIGIFGHRIEVSEFVPERSWRGTLIKKRLFFSIWRAMWSRGPTCAAIAMPDSRLLASWKVTPFFIRSADHWSESHPPKSARWKGFCFDASYPASGRRKAKPFWFWGFLIRMHKKCWPKKKS